MVTADRLIERLERERNLLYEALRISTIQLKDLRANWPERELVEPLEVTLARNRALVPEAFEE